MNAIKTKLRKFTMQRMFAYLIALRILCFMYFQYRGYELFRFIILREDWQSVFNLVSLIVYELLLICILIFDILTIAKLKKEQNTFRKFGFLSSIFANLYCGYIIYFSIAKARIFYQWFGSPGETWLSHYSFDFEQFVLFSMLLISMIIVVLLLRYNLIDRLPEFAKPELANRK